MLPRYQGSGSESTSGHHRGAEWAERKGSSWYEPGGQGGRLGTPWRIEGACGRSPRSVIKLVGTEAASLALRLSLPPYSRDCIPRINPFFPRQLLLNPWCACLPSPPPPQPLPGNQRASQGQEQFHRPGSSVPGAFFLSPPGLKMQGDCFHPVCPISGQLESAQGVAESPLMAASC